MTDDKMQPDLNDRSGQTEPEMANQPPQVIQISTSALPSQRPTPRQRPLLHLKDHAAKPVHQPPPNSRTRSP